MVNPLINDKNILEDVAIKLNWNLHSGASENIVSSLLTASFNSSEGFRKWFCKTIYRKDIKNEFYAAANDSIPYIMKNPSGKRKCKNLPSHPDILIWNREEESKWKKVNEYTLSKHDRKTREIAFANAKKIHAIFVEVKHTSLSADDRVKYVNFLKKLSKFKHGNATSPKSSNKHKLVVISSHNRKAVNRIRQSGAGAGENEKQWVRLISDGKVTHITLEDIYQAIRKWNQWCNKCPIILVFRCYLALNLWKLGDDIFKKYWNEIIDYCRLNPHEGIYELKQEIADSIRSLAEMNFYSLPKSGARAYNSQKIETLIAIYVIKSGNNDNRVEFRYDEQGNCSTVLEIIKKIGSRTKKTIGKVDFEEEISQKSTLKIDQLMKDLLRNFD